MISVVIASTWMNMGGATLIYLAALQNIPGELYEAAELDGAGLFRRIWHVTIPQTRLILSHAAAAADRRDHADVRRAVHPDQRRRRRERQHDRPWSYLIYQYAFALSGASNYNSASALGVVLMLVLAVFSGGYLWLSRERG